MDLSDPDRYTMVDRLKLDEDLIGDSSVTKLDLEEWVASLNVPYSHIGIAVSKNKEARAISKQMRNTFKCVPGS
ncbi:hypothetical protein Tco_1218151 [Tanacetum coccineum]